MEEDKINNPSHTFLNSLSGKELAFLGDSVFEVNVRNALILKDIRGSKDLSAKSKDFVSAKAQSIIYDELLSHLKEEEILVCNKGRNVKQTNLPKNTTSKEYRKATALECLFGYLYITNNNKRINELINIIFDNIENR